MRLTVNVTEAHISAGVAGDCGRCPIALALEGQLPNLSVYSTAVRYGDIPWERHDVKLPAVARNFIAAFDDGQQWPPFSFELELP